MNGDGRKMFYFGSLIEINSSLLGEAKMGWVCVCGKGDYILGKGAQLVSNLFDLLQQYWQN